MWVDRSGKVGDPIGALNTSTDIRLSPDGTRVAFHQPTRDGADDVYIYDIGQKITSPLTKHPGTDHGAIWSPDGAYVAYTRFRGTDQGIYQMRADGATPERVLVPIDLNLGLTLSCAIGDATLLCSDGAETSAAIVSGELWAVPLSGDRTPFLYLPRVSGNSGALPKRSLARLQHQ